MNIWTVAGISDQYQHRANLALIRTQECKGKIAGGSVHHRDLHDDDLAKHEFYERLVDKEFLRTPKSLVKHLEASLNRGAPVSLKAFDESRYAKAWEHCVSSLIDEVKGSFPERFA